MPLKVARAYYAGQEFSYSPLWQKLGPPFQRFLLARAGDREFTDELYVSARIPTSGGLTEDDITLYLEGERRRLFLVQGPAGLGKTTFLRHAIRHLRDRIPIAGAWIDVLNQIQATDSREVHDAVVRLVSARLETHVHPRDSDPWVWRRFFLERVTDPTGTVGMLREELERSGTLVGPQLEKLERLLDRTDLIELIRLKLRFLRRVLARTPLVVIDNVDQLEAATLRTLAQLGTTLAEPPSDPLDSDEAAAETAEGSAKVILALRPVSWGHISTTVNTAMRGVLHRPDIGQVLARRLDAFLPGFKAKLVPEGRPRRPPGAPEPAAGETGEASADDLARDLVRRVTALLTSEDTPYGTLGQFVHTLTSYNTRVCLVATAQYVASGHIDWDDLLGGRPLHAVLTWPKMLKAMILGVRSIYASRSSWVYNLFNDGEPDTASILVRPRLLRVLACYPEDAGVSYDSVRHDLAKLFGYTDERIRRNWEDALERGIIYEREQARFILSRAGEAWLRHMSAEFEYLQHVAIDTWVDADHLVRCTRSDEPSTTRYERVLQLADWIRILEIEGLARVIRNDALVLYDKYFGDDTLALHFCSSLLAVQDRIRKTGDAKAWEALAQRTNRLRDLSRFAAMKVEADAQARSS